MAFLLREPWPFATGSYLSRDRTTTPSGYAGVASLQRHLTRAGLPWVQVAEDGWLKGEIKRRVLRALGNRGMKS